MAPANPKKSNQQLRAPRLAKSKRVLDALKDTLDFRDRVYEPALVEVPEERPVEVYAATGVPILDQKSEGACTGYALATVANFLLWTRKARPDRTSVSPRMCYEMAKRYDEWPGENYEGSSARGAMKGWHKHGICSEKRWPSIPGRPDKQVTPDRIKDAAERPLGAYCRVNHRDVVAMHAAITEVGILFATGIAHDGWDEVKDDGVIEFRTEGPGGHAFAIVGYDRHGFWLQNSWGKSWGKGGFGRVSYDDWLVNGTDVWVARLGAPIEVVTAAGAAATRARSANGRENYAFQDLRPHIVSLGNDGAFRNNGTFATDESAVAAIVGEDLLGTISKWTKKRILLYAHGGLVDESSAVQKVADLRQPLLDAHVYPLSFIWKTDYWTTLTNMLEDALRRRRPEGILSDALDFAMDRADDAIEVIARTLTGKAEWDEMKENARLATESAEGGARKTADLLAKLLRGQKDVEIHLVGHSAGSIFHGHLVEYLTAKLKRRVDSCTLWAPACTVDLFKEKYLPAIKNGKIGRFRMFTLTDTAEQDDNCGRIYNKSLLYLVSDAFEERPRIPPIRDGVPILGMQKFVEGDRELAELFRSGAADWVRAPNTGEAGPESCSTAKHHGDFDDDVATLQSTLAAILGKAAAAVEAPAIPRVGKKGRAKVAAVAEIAAAAEVKFHKTAFDLRRRRLQLTGRTAPPGRLG